MGRKFKRFSPISQYLDDVRVEKSSVHPDLRLNRIKSSVKSNRDEPRFTVRRK